MPPPAPSALVASRKEEPSMKTWRVAEDVHAHFVGAGSAGWQQDSYVDPLRWGKVDFDHPDATRFSVYEMVLRRTTREVNGRAAGDEMRIAYPRHGLKLPYPDRITDDMAFKAVCGFNDYTQRTLEHVVALCADRGGPARRGRNERIDDARGRPDLRGGLFLPCPVRPVSTGPRVTCRNTPRWLSPRRRAASRQPETPFS